MSQLLRTLARTSCALVEAFVVDLVLLFFGFQVFGAPWRTWIDDPLAARLLPAAICITITLLFLLLTRRRYELSLRPSETVRRAASVILPVLLICFALSIDVLADEKTLSLITPFAVATSCVAILHIALMEEAIHRFVLMGLLLRAGVGPLLAVLVQAVFFMFAHGRAAFTSPQTVAWYFSASLTLGVVYLATRRLWVAILLHFTVDVLVAQTSPSAYWLTHRTVESLRFPWTDATAAAWLVLDALLLWRIAVGRGMETRSSYNRPHG